MRSAQLQLHCSKCQGETRAVLNGFSPKLTRTRDDEESENEHVNPHRGVTKQQVLKQILEKKKFCLLRCRTATGRCCFHHCTDDASPV